MNISDINRSRTFGHFVLTQVSHPSRRTPTKLEEVIPAMLNMLKLIIPLLCYDIFLQAAEPPANSFFFEDGLEAAIEDNRLMLAALDHQNADAVEMLCNEGLYNAEAVEMHCYQSIQETMFGSALRFRH